MRTKISAPIILLLAFSTGYIISFTQAIGVANVEVTSVYWGSNPLEPSAAHPGDVNVQLSVVLSNVGDDVARKVNATLFLEPPLSYAFYSEEDEYSAASLSKFAGDIAPGSSFTLVFTLSIDSDAEEGVYRYPLQISYKSARELQQIKKEVTIDVPIWKGDLQIRNVLTDPPKIFPGSRQVQVKVFTVNSGTGSESDVQLRMDLTDPFTVSSSGSDRIFLGNLPAGQVSEADFIIDVADDASFGQYSLILFQEIDMTTIPIGEVPLYLNEKVKFKVLNVTPTTFSPGDSGDVIRVEVKNTGSVKAESVRIQLRVGNFFSGTLTDFLGNMLAGEVKVAFFTVDIDAKASVGQYNFDLRFDWTQDGYALDDTLTVSLNLESPTFPVTQIMIVIFGVIAIVAVYVIIKRVRARRSRSS